MKEWLGIDGKYHQGIIDPEDPYMQLRLDDFPGDIQNLQMFNFKRDKVNAYQRCEQAINQGLIIWPASINQRNEIEFEDKNEDGSVQIRYERVTGEDLRALIELDLLKEEAVAMQKYKNTNGTVRYDLSVDAVQKKYHDDRIDCLAMMANRLMLLRAKEALETERKQSDFVSLFKNSKARSNNSSNPFSSGTNPFFGRSKSDFI